jgi:cyclopropane fatty-acyl-phospholipid synthase-like methyltransferase
MSFCTSEAAERNKGPILGILTVALAAARNVLEIGSGTGQHAVHFASHLPHLSWQPTDTGEYLQELRARLQQAAVPNLRPVLELDVRQHPWPVGRSDAIFTANTLHIMSWDAVCSFFAGVGQVLSRPGVLCIYGPFRYAGGYTSQSNATFDAWLRQRDAASGIRDFESISQLAGAQGLALRADHALPANNQLLVWERSP